MAARTLHYYIGKQFLLRVGLVLSVIALLVYLVDVMDLLRRAGNKDVPFWVVLQMGGLRLLSLLLVVFPFAVYIGTLLCYSKLTHSRELIVVRAAGISVWQFLFSAVMLAALLGALVFSALQPLSAVSLKLFAHQESRYFSSTPVSAYRFGDTMWFKEKLPSGTALLHAKSVTLNSDNMVELREPIWMLLDGEHNLQERIYSQKATLMPGSWLFDTAAGSEARKTAFNKSEVENAVREVETIGFWQLPAHIKHITASGFPAMQHALSWHSLLATPLLFVGMVLLASLFAFGNTRRGKAGLMIALGIFIGFAMYFGMNLISTMTLSGAISPALGAWVPPAVITLIGAALLLHKEDG